MARSKDPHARDTRRGKKGAMATEANYWAEQIRKQQRAREDEEKAQQKPKECA